MFQKWHLGEKKDFTIPFKYSDIERYTITAVNEISGETNQYKHSKVLYGKYGLGWLVVLILLTSVI